MFALRFSGVLLSSLVRPHVMILGSLVSCVIAALLLALTAHTSLALLYIGVGVIGFFISLQFASGGQSFLTFENTVPSSYYSTGRR